MPPPEGTPNTLASFIRNTSARVKTFANEEVGSRVVAPFARSDTPASRRGRHDASPSAGSPSARARDDSDGSVPGDGTHLGATRDHTHLFTRLRDTAIYIRETEAAARAADALEEARAAGFDSVEAMEAAKPVPRRGVFRRRAPEPRPAPPAPPDPPSASFVALCDAADALAGHRRAIEKNLLPQYLSFVDSLRAAARAASSPAARPDAQSDVETHLATLLLVEAELQAALKRLKVGHIRAGTIAVTPGDPEETLMKRNVVNAHAIARTSLTARFKSARDGVGEMLKGNAAAKVMSQQRLLRASDAAYGDLERFYASLVRLRAELAAHPKTTGAAGARVSAATREAAAAARAALRAAYEEATAVKRGGGPDAGADSGADSGADDGERAWIAHVAALDAELARETRAARNAAPGTPGAAVLPGSRVAKNGAGGDGDDRADEAPGVTTREVATAAIEHVRDALRNAVDSIEDAARACAVANSAAAGASAGATKTAASPSTPARTPAKTPARTPATPATPSPGPSRQLDPRANRIVGLGSTGSRRPSRFAPSSPASPPAAGMTTRGMTGALTTPPPTTTTTPRMSTPGSSTARVAADALGFRRTMSRLVQVKDETAALFRALHALAESESTEESSPPPAAGARAWFRRMRAGKADARAHDASATARVPTGRVPTASVSRVPTARASSSSSTTAEDASGANEDGNRGGVLARMREWARRVKKPPVRRERSQRYTDIAERHRNRQT